MAVGELGCEIELDLCCRRLVIVGLVWIRRSFSINFKCAPAGDLVSEFPCFQGADGQGIRCRQAWNFIATGSLIGFLLVYHTSE